MTLVQSAAVSTESQGSGASSGARPDLEQEQEVDVGRYWRAIVRRWWVVVLATGVGVIVGYLVSLGGDTVYQARATVYLGQPLTPTNSSQIQSFQTNPSSVNQIVKSRSVVKDIADQVGVSPDVLRRGISSKAVSGSLSRLGQTPLVEIAVRGPWRQQSAEAAGALADVVVERVSGYANAKIEGLTELQTAQQRQIDSVEGTIARYRSELEANSPLTPAEELVLIGLLNSAEQQRADVAELKTQTDLALTLAKEVEQAQVVTEPAAVKVAARSRRTSMVVGGIIGLVAGIVVALVWDAVARRRGAPTSG